MADIIITRSRRGLFNTEEWETFAGPNGAGPVDTRVFFRCRNPSCWRIWTMEQSAYRVIDIEVNPIQCAECGSYDITATWCNTQERPYTHIHPDTIDQYLGYFEQLYDWRDAHGGQDPTPEDGTAWTNFLRLQANICIWDPWHTKVTNYKEYRDVDGDGDKELVSVPYPYSSAQYFEVFHKLLPTLEDSAFYNATGKATKWDNEPSEGYYVKDNKNFYRCIINMVIQTEHTGGTGGSGA